MAFEHKETRAASTITVQTAKDQNVLMECTTRKVLVVLKRHLKLSQRKIKKRVFKNEVDHAYGY